jgi:ribosomal protein L7/L12
LQTKDYLSNLKISMTLIWIGLVLLGMAIAFSVYSIWRNSTAGRSKLLPKAGTATMADVERLVRSGEKVLAIRCYREIHDCSLRAAKQAIEDLSI